MERQRELKKHAAAIHCANTLSLLQRKISNALLFHAYHELPFLAEHEITVKQLCISIGYKGNNHQVIKESLRGLITTLIEWNVLDKETNCEDWTASSILASVRIKGPLCRYAYSPRMKELLYCPAIYGKINLIIQSKFQSSYGLALYENCIRYRELPHTKWFELDVFRALMGVPASKYNIFRDLKKRVIDKAVEEVNQHSDIKIEAELQKTGRKVSKIRFKLRIKSNKSSKDKDIDEKNQSSRIEFNQSILNSLITEFALNSYQAKAILKEYGEGYIVDKIKIIKNTAIFIQGKVKNVSGYLLHALKNDYQPPISSYSLAVNQHKPSAQEERELVNAKIEERSRQNYSRYVKENVNLAISNLPSAIYQEMTKKFVEHIVDKKVLFRRYQEVGFDSEMIKSTFREYIKNFCSQYYPKLLSYEEYCEQSKLSEVI